MAVMQEEVIDVAHFERESFENLPDAAWMTILEMTEANVLEKVFRKQWREAQLYYAAHLAAMMLTPSGGLGPVSSTSFAGQSTNFTMPVANTNETFGETQYGRRYKMIKESCVVPFLVI